MWNSPGGFSFPLRHGSLLRCSPPRRISRQHPLSFTPSLPIQLPQHRHIGLHWPAEAPHHPSHGNITLPKGSRQPHSNAPQQQAAKVPLLSYQSSRDGWVPCKVPSIQETARRRLPPRKIMCLRSLTCDVLTSSACSS